MPKRRTLQEPTLFSRETQVVPARAERGHRTGSLDIQAFNFFDAAYPSRENIENWGHLQPECIEDITDPDSIQALRIASICEVLNDDALNGMIAVGAESLIGTGCQMRVQCGLLSGHSKNRKYNELEQYIEHLWDEWCKDVQYARLLRTAARDWMQFGSYFRRIIQNPHKKMGVDVVLVSPLRIQTPYDLQEGDFTFIDGERLRVYNGIAFDEYRNERFYCVSERPAFTNPAPDQRKFNGDYGFPFVATKDEFDAGSVIVRGNLIGVSHRNVEEGQHGTAELQGTVTIKKAADTEFEQGDIVFWDTAEKLAVDEAGAGIVRLGICKITPSENAETVEVLTNAVVNA